MTLKEEIELKIRVGAFDRGLVADSVTISGINGKIAAHCVIERIDFGPKRNPKIGYRFKVPTEGYGDHLDIVLDVIEEHFEGIEQ